MADSRELKGSDEPRMNEEDVPGIEDRDYSVTLQHRGEHRLFNAEEIVYRVDFKDSERDPSILTFLGGIENIVSAILDQLDSHDRIQLTITSDNGDIEYPIALPSIRVEFFNFDLIADEITRNLNSNANFKVARGVSMRIVVIRMPKGEGYAPWGRKYMLMDRWIACKARSVVTIKNTDKICLARAIAVAIAKIVQAEYRQAPGGGHPVWLTTPLVRYLWGANEYNRVRRSDKFQWSVAQYLIAETEKLCGGKVDGGEVRSVTMFQQFLNTLGVDLTIFSRPSYGFIIARSPEPQPRHIYLYYTGSHFNVINSVPAFLTCAHFCDYCKTPFRERKKHKCSFKCDRCYLISSEGSSLCTGPLRCCDDCNRYFAGSVCFQNHIGEICAQYQVCKMCGLFLSGKRAVESHDCDITVCTICRESYDNREEHNCYMPVLKEKRKGPEGENSPPPPKRYVIFDTEAWLNESDEEGFGDVRIHKTCCVVAMIGCTSCLGENDGICSFCKTEKCHTFFGSNCVGDFCEWLCRYQEEMRSELTAISHNFSGYDVMCLLKHLYEKKATPDVIFRGNKVLMMFIKEMNIRFIDSLNYLKMPLSKMPKTLGFDAGDMKKGYFPYLFNTERNAGKVFTGLPDKYNYGIDKMTRGEIAEFEKWYELNKTNIFDLNKECVEYCVQDVRILLKAVMTFQSLFNKMTTDEVRAPYGMDCFEDSFTIAGAANRCFRQIHLAPKTLALYPQGRFQSKRKHSFAGDRWIAYLNTVHKFDPPIRREVRLLGRFSVDGYREDENGEKHVYEFSGCWFHGDLRHINRKIIHPYRQVSMGHLHDETQNRLKMLKDAGFIVHHQWECDFNDLIKKDETARQIVAGLEIHEPFKLHDALKGGRTNGIKLYCKIDPQREKIRYYDVKSLYPYIMKNRLYPVGHPVVITENFEPLSTVHVRYKGLIACTVLAPKNLYIPLLHYTCRGKLMFPLCKACCEAESQTSCTHPAQDRAFYGIYTHVELEKAVALGYKIMKVYEIYDWKEWSRDIFSSYINTFFKVKEESSGFPSHVQTDAEKESYIEKIYAEEGIRLDSDKIEYNPGMRNTSKLICNTLWGKMCQRNDLEKHVYISNPEEFFQLVDDDTLEVRDIHWITEELVFVRYKFKDLFSQASKAANVTVGIFTCAYGRLILFDYMQRVGLQNVLYFDTDSIIFLQQNIDCPSEPDKLLGSALGALTDELDAGDYIVEFVCGGPKHYMYRTKDGVTKVVIKGIKITSASEKIITFERLRDMVLNDLEEVEECRIVEHGFFVRDVKKGEVKCVDRKKLYRVVYNKRRLMKSPYNSMTDTVPFGWVD